MIHCKNDIERGSERLQQPSCAYGVLTRRTSQDRSPTANMNFSEPGSAMIYSGFYIAGDDSSHVLVFLTLSINAEKLEHFALDNLQQVVKAAIILSTDEPTSDKIIYSLAFNEISLELLLSNRADSLPDLDRWKGNIQGFGGEN